MRKTGTARQIYAEVRRDEMRVYKALLKLEKKHGRMAVFDVLGEWFTKPHYGKFRIGVWGKL